MPADPGLLAAGHTPSTGTPESIHRESCTPGSVAQQQGPTPQRPTASPSPLQQACAVQQPAQPGGMPQEAAPLQNRLLPVSGHACCALQAGWMFRSAREPRPATPMRARTVATRGPLSPPALLQAAPSLAWDLHTSPEFLMQLPPGSPASPSRSSSLDGALTPTAWPRRPAILSSIGTVAQNSPHRARLSACLDK